MKKFIISQRSRSCGFTLIEVMIAVGLFGLVITGVLSVYLMCRGIWHSTTLKMDTTRAASMAISRMVYGIETNPGLRSAAALALDTACAGVYQSWVAPTNFPPAANAASHWVATNYAGDGSWRLTVSNQDGRVTWIDYNINAQNMVFWPNTLNAASRKLIANHVTSATVSNRGDGVEIFLTVAKRDGRFTATNQAATFVKRRNKP